MTNDVSAALKWLKGSWQASDNRSEAANAAAVIEAMAAVGVRQEAEIKRLTAQLRKSCDDERSDPEGHACPIGCEVQRLQEIIARCYMRLQCADVPREPWHWEVCTTLDNTGIPSAHEPSADATPLERAFSEEPQRSIVDEAIRKLGATDPQVWNDLRTDLMVFGVSCSRRKEDGTIERVEPNDVFFKAKEHAITCPQHPYQELAAHRDCTCGFAQRT